MNNDLDKTDLKILKILQENGRITNLQLSSEIGLSPAPTLERVKKLEQAGVITGYHAILDKKSMGIGLQAFMLVSLSGHKSTAIKKFVDDISQIEEIVECYHVTGSGDHLLRIMVADIASYEKLVMDKISTLEGVAQMQTMIVLSWTKESRVLPVKYS